MTPRKASAGAMRSEDEGMEQALEAHRLSVQLWKIRADEWLASLLPGFRFICDDLIRAIGLPDPLERGLTRNHVVGAYISGWASAGKIRAVAGVMVKSKRIPRHAGKQQLWEKL